MESRAIRCARNGSERGGTAGGGGGSECMVAVIRRESEFDLVRVDSRTARSADPKM